MSSTMGPTRGVPLPQRAVDKLSTTIEQRPKPPTKVVFEAEGQLAAAFSQSQGDLRALLSSRTEDVGKQVVHAKELLGNVATSSADLNKAGADFDANKPRDVPEVSKFLDVTSGRKGARENTVIAKLTLTALRSLKIASDQLRHLESAIWSGRGADLSTLDALQTFTEGEGSELNSEAMVALLSRGRQLKLLLSEQLSSAWSQAISIENESEGLSLKVAGSITLTPPQVTGVATQRTSKPMYNLPQLNAALQRMGSLEPLLDHLQSQITRELVTPIVASQSLAVEEYSPGDSVLRFRSCNGLGLADTISGVRYIVRFVQDNICPQSVITAELSIFLSRFSDAAYQQVLQSIVIPSIPQDLDGFPLWLQQVEQCARWEEDGPAGKDGGILRQFLNSKIGTEWLTRHRSAGLVETRNLVCAGWQSWEARSEEMDEQAQSRSNTQIELDENGWGFEGDPSGGKSDQVILEPAHEEGSEGWDFDDIGPTPAVPSPPAARLAKPAREAKRLGKKMASKSSASAEHDELPAGSGGVQPSPLSSSRNSRSPSRERSPSPKAKSYVADTSICVSSAVDAASELLRKRLLELNALRGLSLPAKLYDALWGGLQSQLMEVLDFLRATLPVVHRRAFIDSPTKIVQLGNDFRYLATKILKCEPNVAWALRKEAASEYDLAASVAYQTFRVHQQQTIRTTFEATNNFVDLTEADVHLRAEGAMEELTRQVTEVAVQLKSLVDDELYHKLFGVLVDTVCVLVIDAVLALEDITEVESQCIVDLLQEVEPIQTLFKSDNLGMSSIATFAPHWLKMCYTIEILRGNLADITRLYENGSLVDFTPGQLSKLIRALFADSQKRAALLDKVQQGSQA